MYEVIVLGATFTAAGIAHRFEKNCLILEQSLQAGCEFFGALNFGSDYGKAPEIKEAKILCEEFKKGDIYSRDSLVYPYLSKADVLFATSPVKAEKTEKGYSLLTYGVDGFCTYEAKMVIDTRCSEEISLSKTFNMLIESKVKPNFTDTDFFETGIENHYVLKLSVPLDCNYSKAKTKALGVVHGFNENQRLILLASYFDNEVKEDYVKQRDGIIHLPSKAYKNPVFAFEAGLKEAVL